MRAAAAAACSPSHALQPRIGDHELAAGEERVDSLALRDEADAPVHLRVAARMARRATVTLPDEGARKPATMCRIVDLPAPFGPSRPVMPPVEPEADVVDGDHVAVPARDALASSTGGAASDGAGSDAAAVMRRPGGSATGRCRRWPSRAATALEATPNSRDAGGADRRIGCRPADQPARASRRGDERVDQRRHVPIGPFVTASTRMAPTAAVTMKTAMIAPVA